MIEIYMIDYKKLREKFTAKLNEFDEEKLLKWMDFDENRKVVDRLLSGESVSIHYETTTPYRLTDKLENIDSAFGDNSYATAA